MPAAPPRAAAAGSSTANWSTLMTAEWGLAPGQEHPSDVHTIVADRGIFVGGIRPIDPQGTHHTVLALGNLNTGNILYASGVGTNGSSSPRGSASRSAGRDRRAPAPPVQPDGRVHLGAERHRDRRDPRGRAGARGRPVPPGPLDLSIAPNQQTVESNTCTVGVEQTYFAIFPHMHQLGTALQSHRHRRRRRHRHPRRRVQLRPPGVPADRSHHPEPGDSITTECTGTTPQRAPSAGARPTTEMCFSIVYRYPKQNDAGFCP
ncbi:MAG: hypothetical protein IPG04_38570 [Polyangiaceae bacterium]|nr:hypothetical protein [Polyangiaceae bacterium]